MQCILDRRSVVEDGRCEGARPRDRQPCYNTECAGVWVLGEWSPVSRYCRYTVDIEKILSRYTIDTALSVEF